jgi:hypothetical protein
MDEGIDVGEGVGEVAVGKDEDVSRGNLDAFFDCRAFAYILVKRCEFEIWIGVGNEVLGDYFGCAISTAVIYEYDFLQVWGTLGVFGEAFEALGDEGFSLVGGDDEGNRRLGLRGV